MNISGLMAVAVKRLLNNYLELNYEHSSNEEIRESSKFKTILFCVCLVNWVSQFSHKCHR